ncbi:hypothetical protein [Deinococcus maricopensis]|uniref:TspO and MBR like protein n=1 Tax=Deinococcus maricopensis (strain DSM 21211 / LMG 22137 / NRRL B-23946 / LB-34) TaxID=709986 RepID=E8UB84_DEIML|nr:hypothetical protein [Deinococcus maricopensis]ADV68323.1 hypothetical protein Deima_2692 [Deinococcus maricopensis DSM 21211]
MSGLLRQWTLLASAVATIVMNALANALPLFGRNTGEISDDLPNAFTPTGATFAVWGVIFLGLLVFAVYQALPAQRGARYDQLCWPFLLGCALNVTWLLAWHSLHLGWSVVVMLALLADLVWLYVTLDRLALRGAERWALGVPGSLYLAWITVATVANITAYLVSVDAPAALLGWSAPTWSAALVVVASLVGAWLLARRRDVPFALVLLWAFYGVYAARPEVTTVLIGVIVAVGVLGVGAVAGARRPRAAR